VLATEPALSAGGELSAVCALPMASCAPYRGRRARRDSSEFQTAFYGTAHRRELASQLSGLSPWRFAQLDRLPDPNWKKRCANASLYAAAAAKACRLGQCGFDVMATLFASLVFAGYVMMSRHSPSDRPSLARSDGVAPVEAGRGPDPRNPRAGDDRPITRTRHKINIASLPIETARSPLFSLYELFYNLASFLP